MAAGAAVIVVVRERRRVRRERVGMRIFGVLLEGVERWEWWLWVVGCGLVGGSRWLFGCGRWSVELVVWKTWDGSRCLLSEYGYEEVCSGW